MNRRKSAWLAFFLAFSLSVSMAVEASKSSGGSKSSGTKSVHVRGYTKKDGTSVAPHERSESAKRTFERQTGYPNGRAGYVVDHIRPLACGGADAPSNMQWQTIAEARAKDKTERIGCR